LKSKNRVSVEILGEEYVMKAAAPSEYIKEVAAFVDERMKGISREYPGLGARKVAVLTCLNLAHELIQTRRGRPEDESRAGPSRSRRSRSASRGQR